MAEQMVQIRSVKQYFNDFIAGPINRNELNSESGLIDVKAKLLKAFQQELYGQIVFKLGPEAAEMKPDDLADLSGIQNILQQTFRKWRRLCILCSENGLGNYFQLEDLQDALKDGPNANVTVPDLEEDVTDKLDEILPPGEKPVYLEQNEAKDNENPKTDLGEDKNGDSDNEGTTDKETDDISEEATGESGSADEM